MSDVLESFEGPRTIRYFAVLLAIFTMLFVLGVVLSELYGLTLLESLTEGFIENPTGLLDLAGLFAFLALLFIGGQFVWDYAR